RQAESFGGLEVDRQLKLRRLLDRQVTGLGAREDLVHVGGGAPPELAKARPVRHEAPRLHIRSIAVCCRQAAPCCEVRKPCSVEDEHRIGHYKECSCALFGHRRECAVELVGTSSLQQLKLHLQRPGRDLQFLYEERLDRIGRVRKDRHTVDLGDGLLEQLQPFASYFRADGVGQPCDVPARACQARDESEPNSTGTTGNHDDGDRLGGILGCRYSLRPLGHDDVHFEPDQLDREVGQPVEPTLSGSIVDDDILALDPPELAQRLPERVEVGPRKYPKKPYPAHLPGLLRLGSERPSEERTPECADERSPLHYSITSSARPSSEGGIVRPRALAVLRLMTSSNLVGLSIGRSPGLAPLRIRAT